MNWRLLLLLIGLVALSKVVGYYLGSAAEWLVIAGIAVLGAGTSIYHERVLHRLTKTLSEQADPERALVNLPDFAERADLADRLSLPEPPVPLRASAEQFAYPPAQAIIMKLLGSLSLAMLALVTYLMITDPAQRGGSWFDLVAGIGILGGGGLYFVYWGWFAGNIFEVTDSHLALRGWRGVHRTIPWGSVSSCYKYSSGLKVRGAGTTIHASYLLEDYGRYVNLVRSRVHPSVRE